MVHKDKILSQLADLTDKISTQVRTVAIGVLALTWGLLVGDSPTAASIAAQLRPSLVLLGGGSVLVLFLDFLQYSAGYFSVDKLRRQMEAKGVDEGQYDYDDFFYRLRGFFFWAKQIALAFTVLTLLLVFGRWILLGPR